MAKTAKKSPLAYKIEDGVQLTGWSNFDTDTPEYRTMMKMNIDQSFPFKEERKVIVTNTKLHLKRSSGLTFAVRQERDEKTKALIPGVLRVWRVDPKTARKYRKRGNNSSNS